MIESPTLVYLQGFSRVPYKLRLRMRAPRAAVRQHLREVRRKAVVGARLDSEADALGAALLAEAHGLVHVRRGVPGQRVVQVTHEVVPVL